MNIMRKAEILARTMALIANEAPAVAAVGRMELSVKAEAFGAGIRFAEDAMVYGLSGEASELCRFPSARFPYP